MKIGIDAQALQTENSKDRGIGRYSKNLINEIIRLDSKNDYKVFLNSNFDVPDNLTINANEIISLKYIKPENSSERTVNEIGQLLQYGNNNLDILQIMSTAEGFPSYLPVTNEYIDHLNAKLCTIIYDLIPLHFQEHYFSNPNFKSEYFKQLKTLYHSDILFAISESTRLDAINLLGIHPDKIITIYGGISDKFFKIPTLDVNKISKLKKKYSILNRFVLYTGGIEFRKNIEKSITEFSKINSTLLDDVSYVIVCNINELDKNRLTKLAIENGVSKNIVFTGYIPDDELNLLYNSCDVFIFPSLIEGLGIPILEAMKCGAPVIGSDSSSISELINNVKFTFNPENGISLLLNKILSDDKFRDESIKNSHDQIVNYSWEKSAKKVISTYLTLELTKKKNPIKMKPKIAFFSPLPPKKSGISYYSSNLLPLLSKYWDIDIFIDDDYSCDVPFINSNFCIFSYHEFETLNQQKHYDTIIYQIGNSDNHIYMFDILQKFPGIVVLHDIFLGGVIHWMTGRIGKQDKFIEEIIYSHGDSGKKLVGKAKKGLIPWSDLIWNLQINKRILDSATHVILHSEWDRKKVLELYPQLNKKISLVHQFSPLKEINDKLKIKQQLGFSENEFLICSFGFVVETKKIDLIIKNIANFLKTHDAKYVIVGEMDPNIGDKINKIISDLKLEEKVIVTNFLDEKKYFDYIQICDLNISLRTKTRAGTSASINHSLGAGIPTITSDVEPFNEFPDDVVLKIKPDKEKNLDKILTNLYDSRTSLSELGIRGKNYAKKFLSKDECVEKYVKIIENSLLSIMDDK